MAKKQKKKNDFTITSLKILACGVSDMKMPSLENLAMGQGEGNL